MSGKRPYVSEQAEKIARALHGGTVTETFEVTIVMAANLAGDERIARLIEECLTGGGFLAVRATISEKGSSDE